MKKKKDGDLIVVSGPSGAGKDTIVSELLKRNKNIYLSISMTTRDRREKEKDGVDYYFVDEEKFIDNIKKDNFLEYAKVYDKYYGTPKDEVVKRLEKGIDVVLVIDITGALNIKKMFKDAIFIFIMPPDLKTLMRRIIDRNRDPREKMLKRFKEDYKLVNEFNKYNYVVVNDNISDAVHKVESILLASKCSAQRIEDLELDNEEEIIHEFLVD
ncbi:MAG: guanylate kinase [Bacilli bacterium]|nr:guanylate kinase [Bacilli bacterium]